MASKPGKQRSFANRAGRFFRRTYREYFGPGIKSVQKLSDEEFGSLLQLDADTPSIKGAEASKTIIGHFSKRVDADWPEVPACLTDLRLDLSQLSKAEVIARADTALAGDLHPSGVKPEFTDSGRLDWSTSPGGNREWLLMIHRHSWWSLWAAAYVQTGDEKYAKAFVSQLTDWIDRHPTPRQKSEHLASWRLMEAGLRMRVSWIPAFGAFFRSPEFDDSVKMKMLRAIYDHGQFLNMFCTNRNHLVRESNGLISVGLCFREFVNAKSWVETGLKRLDDELRAQVNEDGSHIEMSIGYQWLTIDEFEATSSLLSRYKTKLPNSDLNESLYKLYGFLAGVIRPDRAFPQLNDGFILWGADRLIDAAQRSSWADIVYSASAGDEGIRPKYCSRSFPNAGLHVMRSDWDAEARYLVFDTGPYGGPHGHEDKLSFELSAYGVPFVVDPGSYTYEKRDPFRNYFVGSPGHNTVVVDQMSQIRRWSSQHMNPAVDNRVFGTWEAGEAVDFASGKYDEGYAPFALVMPENAKKCTGVCHQRDIIFVKPDYWVVVDYLDAGKTHDYEFLFHLAPDIRVDVDGERSAICWSLKNDARLRVDALTSEAVNSETVIGNESPIQGWYSADHHKKVPSSTLIFRCKESGSICVAWLLFPLRPGVGSDVVQASIVPATGTSDLQIEITFEGRTDLVTIGNDQAARNASGHSPCSRLSLIREGQRIWSIG